MWVLSPSIPALKPSLFGCCGGGQIGRLGGVGVLWCVPSPPSCRLLSASSRWFLSAFLRSSWFGRVPLSSRLSAASPTPSPFPTVHRPSNLNIDPKFLPGRCARMAPVAHSLVRNLRFRSEASCCYLLFRIREDLGLVVSGRGVPQRSSPSHE